MNYLSIHHTPETNLQVIAVNKVLLTKELEEEAQKTEDLNFKLSLSLAMTVSAVAMAIILGSFVSKAIGAVIAAITIIPSSTWLAFKRQEEFRQIHLHQEIEKLKEIYQRVIDALNGRCGVLKNNLKRYHQGQIKIKDWPTQEEMKIWSKKLQCDLEIDFLNTLKFQEFYQDCIEDIFNLDENEKEIVFHTFESVKLLEKSGADLKANIDKIKEHAQLIAQSRLKATVIKDKWEELKQICQEYIRPYESYFSIENGMLVYKD